MPLEGGEVVFRQWNEDTGLEEVAQPFNTLEELFNFCINTHDPLLVDRVYIDGDDENGSTRRLTLVFQSVTISEK
jgi:hypothetical protein